MRFPAFATCVLLLLRFSSAQEHTPELLVQDKPGFTAAAAFGPELRWVAIGSASGRVMVYDLSSRRLIREFFENATAMAAHPAQDELVIAAGGAVTRLDIRTGKTVWRIRAAAQASSTLQIVFSPDTATLVGTVVSPPVLTINNVLGLPIASSKNPEVFVVTWDAATGRELTSHRLADCRIPTALTPGGKWLACIDSSRRARSVLIETAGGRVLKKGIPFSILRMDDRSGRGFGYTEGQSRSVLLELPAGRTIAQVYGFPSWMDSSKVYIFGGLNYHSLEVRNLDDGGLLSSIDLDVPIDTVPIVAPDGQHVLLTSNGSISITLISDPKQRSRLGDEDLHTVDRPVAAVKPAVALFSSGRILAVRCADGDIASWDTADGGPLALGTPGNPASFGLLEADVVKLQNSPDGPPLSLPPPRRDKVVSAAVPDFLDQSGGLSFSPDGTRVVVRGIGKPRGEGLGSRLKRLGAPAIDFGEGYFGRKTELLVYDLATKRTIAQLQDPQTGKPGKFPLAPDSMRWSPDGKYLIGGGGLPGYTSHGPLYVWETGTWKLVGQPRENVQALDFSPDGRFLIIAGTGLEGQPYATNGLEFLSLATGKTAIRLPDAIPGKQIFGPGEKTILAPTRDDEIGIWDRASGAVLGRLRADSRASWVVTTPSGAFDASPDGWRRIVWRLESGASETGPGELYFNEFFHPGLLQDLLEGHTVTAARLLSQVDRRLPSVSIQAAVHGDTASVDIGVSGPVALGTRDLRLFRNGLLVKAWRGKLPVSMGGEGSFRAEIKLLPGDNHLAAYAFNQDNIRSREATARVSASVPAKAGTAYVIAIGINRYAQPEFNLTYAAPDAKAFSAGLKASLPWTLYHEVRVVELLDRDATRANIVQALEILSGKTDPRRPDTPPALAGLRTAEPQDAVFLYFAGHGFASQSRFYLVPHDLGYFGPRAELRNGLPALMQHSISDRDLELMLEAIDAQHIALIVDACQSGQAMESSDERRGPMNTPGLAQLAYEKGMDILAASQSYQAAVESSRLGHGFLTYALVEEGLISALVDRAPRDGRITAQEWFHYATERVPELQLEAIQQRGVQRLLSFAPFDAERSQLQTPRWFSRRDPNLTPLVVAIH